MFTGNRSWIQRVAECVHEDTRDARKKERYTGMILTWAEGMVREGRWRGIRLQDFLRQEHPDWTQKDIATEVRKQKRWGRKPALEHRIDSIAITTHATTPLEKKYATLGAIHDASKHCHYPLSPWNRKPFKNPFRSEATEQDGEDCAARNFYRLFQEDVANLTDDDRSGIEKMLADVAADGLAEGTDKAGSEADGRNGDKAAAEQDTPPQTEGGSRGAMPAARDAKEAIRRLGVNFATVRQLASVTGRTAEAIRSRIYRAINKDPKLPVFHVQEISDPGPQTAKKRYNIETFWEHVQPGSERSQEN